MSPVPVGQLMDHLKAAAAHRVGGRTAYGAAGYVAVHPAREGIEDLAHELGPLAGAPQVEPELGVRGKQLLLVGVQGVRGQLADHRHPVIAGLSLERELARRPAKQAAGDARAGWVPWE